MRENSPKNTIFNIYLSNSCLYFVLLFLEIYFRLRIEMRESIKREGFSMIELVFVIVILGVLAAVAVPRFVATRTDAHVATLRSDSAAALKTIVAKVFADNLDTTHSLAPHPDDKTKTPKIYWSEWIIEVAGLDRNRWMTASAIQDADKFGVSPLYKVQHYRMPCGLNKALISITKSGDLFFDPEHLISDNISQQVEKEMLVCKLLKDSYKGSNSNGNKLIPLTSTNTVEF